jgi:hypothetical protein
VGLPSIAVRRLKGISWYDKVISALLAPRLLDFE